MAKHEFGSIVSAIEYVVSHGQVQDGTGPAWLTDVEFPQVALWPSALADLPQPAHDHISDWLVA
jgi:hypothetical protein